MSLLPPEATAQLARILQALQSTDNVVRTQAEEHLNNDWVNTQPEVLLMGLVESMGGTGDVGVGHILNAVGDEDMSQAPGLGRIYGNGKGEFWDHYRESAGA